MHLLILDRFCAFIFYLLFDIFLDLFALWSVNMCSFSKFDFIVVCCRYLQSSIYQVFTLPPCSIAHQAHFTMIESKKKIEEIEVWPIYPISANEDRIAQQTILLSFGRFYLFSIFNAQPFSGEKWNSIFDRIPKRWFWFEFDGISGSCSCINWCSGFFSFVCKMFRMFAVLWPYDGRIQHDLHILLNENTKKFMKFFFFFVPILFVDHFEQYRLWPMSHNFFSLSLWFLFLLLVLFTFCNNCSIFFCCSRFNDLLFRLTPFASN